MKRSAIIVAAVAAGLLIGAGVAAATDLVCTGLSSGGTWHNVTVPPGASCTLENTRVTGNVTVQTGGTLLINTTATGDTTVAGDIKGDGCNSINLESPSAPFTGRIVVGGNLTIQNCTSGFNGARGRQNETPATVLIGGNVKCSNNDQNCVFDYTIISGNLECSGNAGGCTLQSDAVGKNATLNNNAFGFGDTEVRNSSFGGDVKCSGNNGGVTSSPTNTVAGNKTGQCSGI